MTCRKKNILAALLLIFVVVISVVPVWAQNQGDVYVIPIKGEINKATYQYVSSRVEEVIKNQPAAIIFDIDTYGGLIVEAEKIKNVIMNLEIPTISYINNKAESAGVLIAISSEKVVMAEGGTIGSAETIPNTEKAMSTWISILKSVAEQRGRDSKVIAAMADKDLVIEDVVKKGELLNLHYREAKELGIADEISTNYTELLDKLNIKYNEIIEVDVDFKTKVAGLLTNPYFSSLLLTLAFVGLLIEVFTPGFGAGGTLSFIAFSLFFGSNILAGNSNWGVLIIFIAGIVLLLIEAAIPGFGVPGIGGLVCVIISIILAAGSIETAILSLSIAFVLTILAAVLLVKYGARSPYLDKIVLRTKTDKATGYSSSSQKLELLHQEGTVLTFLRPAGMIDINGQRVDAVSEGYFIEKGAKVKVIKVEGLRVVVRKVE